MAVAERKKIRIHGVRREPVDLDRLAAALLALAQQLADEDDDSNSDVTNDTVPTDVNTDTNVNVDTENTDYIDTFTGEKDDEAST